MINETMLFVCEESDEGKRIDLFLTGAMEDFSRSAIHKLIEDSQITVNGKICAKNYKIKKLDSILVALPALREVNIEPENIPLDVVFEDSSVIIVNKPKNMVVHPAPGHYSGTLVNALLFRCKDELSGINGITRPGIVHRIDKDTSGLIAVAKTNQAHIRLSEQLAERTMKRVYSAIVYNNLRDGEGIINKPMGRNPRDRKKMAVIQGGRDAVTNYKVLERFGKFNYIECRLITGRTHQIRVHLSSIGHPLLGDSVYGPEKHPVDTAGQCLHAKRLTFTHPVTGGEMVFESPLPEYFEKALAILSKQ